MNSRILALLALSFLFSGCTQIASFTSVIADAEPAGESPGTAPDTAGASPTADGISVSVSEEPGPDLATVLTETEATEDAQGQAGSTSAGEEGPGAEPQLSEQELFARQLMEETDAQIHAQLDAQIEAQIQAQKNAEKERIKRLCNEIGGKLGSVSAADCLAQPLEFAGAYSVQSRPMVVRDFFTQDEYEEEDEPRILVLGGIHGDEYSSISIMFKWMYLLQQSDNRDFRWRFAPSVNPDGLLDGQAIRQNANGVDLNRNFPSEDWVALAEDYWANKTNRNPRRYPGTAPASEPEVQWIVREIERFKPDVIVSVHAPYHLLDYDGPPEPPQRIGELHLHLLGVYPGSLGNYAGLNLGIPVVTMELPSAGIMPPDEQIASMWNDLLDWLYEHHET